MRKRPNTADSQEIIWINPIGGLGDMLMVSGVLKQVADTHASCRFNLVRRSAYSDMLQDHPAIWRIGYPPPGSRIIGTNYWAHGMDKNNRPYQILARLFGLPVPAQEILYMPGDIEIDPMLDNMIPWGSKNIVIATGSDSSRKMLIIDHWNHLVKMLKEDGFFVIQTGKLREKYVRRSYSLLGLTNPRQLLALIKRADLVITIDTFAMHAAYLAGTPAVVLWGPTDPDIYGYPGHSHLRAEPICRQIDQCISERAPDNYHTNCPSMEQHCMSQISLDKIRKAAHAVLSLSNT